MTRKEYQRQYYFYGGIMTDILERLKNSSKINGAYPKDIEDAITEIEALRKERDYWFDKTIEYEKHQTFYKKF